MLTHGSNVITSSMREVSITTFDKGLITRLQDESLPVGAASSCLNWHFLGDHVELRRGQAVIGTENSGTGRVTGLKRTVDFAGTEVLFFTYGQKAKYFDAATSDWVEISTDLLGTNGDGQDISLEDYHSLAGAFVYLGSPYTDFYKIPVANPGTAVAQSVTAHRGHFRIKKGRTFLFRRKDTTSGFDDTGLYLSKIDRDELSDYTFVDDEALGSGDGTTVTFTGTLASITGARTAAYVIITDGTETFTDDRNGTLTGDQGGTGTINYGTGAYSVTFNTAPVSGTDNITGDYYYENSTSSGILDFTKAVPRVAGEGAVFRQDDAGAAFQNLGSLDDDEFCFHTLKTYKLTLSGDDTNATNYIFRSRVGIPYFRSFFETGDGIYYVDTIASNEPYIRKLKKNDFYNDIIPTSISDVLELKDYDFTQAVVYEYGDMVMVFCKAPGATANNRALVFNRRWETWEIHDIRASVAQEYNNLLHVGDSASNNVYELFSGWTDEDADIANHIIFGDYDLGYVGVKRANLLRLRGLIARDQKLKVSVSLDGGPFVEVGHTDSGGVHTYAIEGDASYVSYDPVALVGSKGVGTTEVGGGGTGSDVYLYEREFRINTDRFERMAVKVEAAAVGYVSVKELHIRDIRVKDAKALPVYSG